MYACNYVCGLFMYMHMDTHTRIAIYIYIYIYIYTHAHNTNILECFRTSRSIKLCISLPDLIEPILPKSHLNLSVSRSVYLSTYLSIYLSSYLPIHLSICLSIYLSFFLSKSELIEPYLTTYKPVNRPIL